LFGIVAVKNLKKNLTWKLPTSCSLVKGGTVPQFQTYWIFLKNFEAAVFRSNGTSAPKLLRTLHLK
jgi:hypothetical protein